jgi:hypothetical protein
MSSFDAFRRKKSQADAQQKVTDLIAERLAARALEARREEKLEVTMPRRSMAALLADHTDAPYDPKKREFIEGVATRLYDRHEEFAHWPESVRHFYACYDLNYQVGNGGFAQAAYNVPHLIPVAQAAFEKFGRRSAAELCRRATSMLPTELTAHAEKGFMGGESLEEVFAHFDTSAMAVLDQDLPREFWADDALQALVEQHRADFASVG